MELFAPFGPTMGYYRMPDELVDKLNSKMSDKLKDYSDNLVGKVKAELAFDEEIVSIAQEGLGQFVGKYQAYTELRNSFGANSLDVDNYNYGLQVVSGWFVRQFNGEYNPLHIHTGSRLSCVGYLKLPEGIEEEREEYYKDHHPPNRLIQFASGTFSNEL